MLVPIIVTAVSALKVAKVTLVPDIANILGKDVKGEMVFEQNSEHEKIVIKGKITGLSPNSIHGWHIHNAPIENQNCTTGSGHWNPKNLTHGAPEDEERHYGDLGNIHADQNGVVEITITDRLVTLFGDVNAIGRGFVLHEKMDDLGKGNNPTSKTVGNAGSRLACGNIQLVVQQPVKSTSNPVPTYGLQPPPHDDKKSDPKAVVSSAYATIPGFMSLVALLL
jgi:Cu-Zn family superoxide dismutase